MLEATPVGTEAMPKKYHEKRAEWLKKARTGAIEKPKCTCCQGRLRWDNVFTWNDDKGTVKPKKSKKLLCDPCQRREKEKYDDVPERPPSGNRRQPLTEAEKDTAREYNEWRRQRGEGNRKLMGLHAHLCSTEITNWQSYVKYSNHLKKTSGARPLSYATFENYLKVKHGCAPQTVTDLAQTFGLSKEKLING